MLSPFHKFDIIESLPIHKLLAVDYEGYWVGRQKASRELHRPRVMRVGHNLIASCD